MMKRNDNNIYDKLHLIKKLKVFRWKKFKKRKKKMFF